MSKKQKETEIKENQALENTPETPPPVETPTPETPSTDLGQAVPISAADLAEPLAANMPEPTNSENSAPNLPGMGENAEGDPKNPPLTGEIRDKSNRLFDPNRHSMGTDGKPKLNKNGFFIAKGLGRPSNEEKGKATSSGPTSATTQKPASFFNTTGVPDEFDQAAELYLSLGYGVAASFFTDDIRPESSEEHTSLKVPLGAVLREKGVVDLSPTQMFLISLGAFIAKKSAKPTVKEKFTLLYLRVRNFFSKKEFKRPEMKTSEIKQAA